MKKNEFVAKTKNFVNTYQTELIGAGCFIAGFVFFGLVQSEMKSELVQLDFDKKYLPNVREGKGGIKFVIDGVNYVFHKEFPPNV